MLFRAILANVRYGRPTKNIKCIGVTGTDGKTTTNELIYHIAKKAGLKIGIISTISIDVGAGKQKNQSKMTTLQHAKFLKLMKEAQKNGLEYMVVESSSHALFQYRIWPAKFVAVGFTNLTHEHLDFHKTMKNYFKAKAELFSKRVLKKSFGIFPEAFAYKDELKTISNTSQNLTFSQKGEAGIWAENIKETPHLSADICIRDTEAVACKKWLFHFKSQYVGRFNMDNILIAVGICRYLGMGDEKMVQGLETAKNPDGRMDVITTPQGVTVIVDFALTPHALTSLYESFAGMDFGRQIAVFGATGSRDKTKRPLMGELSTRLNDYVIITEDENYAEDGKKIIEDIVAGIPKDRKNYEVVQDREAAIKKALEIAQKGDVILLTGMGNFDTRTMGSEKVKWNDKEVVMGMVGSG